MQTLRFKTQLLEYLKSSGYASNEQRIAVEALIFTTEGKIILEKRGRAVRDEIGKLEGVGGSIGQHTDLLQALKERFENELGEQVIINIDRLLEVRKVTFIERDRGSVDWIIVSYLCKLVDGTPEIYEPDMVDDLMEFTLDELFLLPEDDLSQSTIVARNTYKKSFGNRPYFECP
jgi:hypothetical protein